MEYGNLYRAIPAQLPAEMAQVLAGAGPARIERIVSRGHCSPAGFWYDQPEREWVMVLKGEAALRFEQDDRLVRLAEGDYVDIAAHERHRVEWTAQHCDTIWLAVFY
ncbi:cupin domain-containing protein [Noviherbaspirillum autotrophicum]|uniref:Cupin type-2 domain-containing protein n=1 Tax=Noviherbaspirillum autotrophicum TaxID=709839 RepID=A0A0C1XZG6_9BURK|nr:cupin domain-containing protein [Noviherbaspirillum autotrophicum]KIF80173.1 hypothetical protein TSA66_04085 [Noviherbaspirillum autotrophicum]